MDFAAMRRRLLAFPGAVEDFPFGPEPHVFKVAGKMFAILSEGADDTDAAAGGPATVSLKCDPALAPLLRERYAAVTPGYHLNKVHWNTVALDGSVPDDEVDDWAAMSYERVVAGLPKAVRMGLGV